MFKKPFSVLAAFALGLVISVSIMACADDLQEIVNCNCNDTVKELLTRIEELEKRVNTIKEPNYDSLVQLVVNRINTTTPTPPTDDNCINEERIAAIEQEVAQLKKASTMDNISSYSWIDDGHTENTTYEYDDLGRITKATNSYTYSADGRTETTIWTCSYNNNVCEVTIDWGDADDITSFTYTHANDLYRNFNAIKHFIYSHTTDLF